MGAGQDHRRRPRAAARPRLQRLGLVTALLLGAAAVPAAALSSGPVDPSQDLVFTVVSTSPVYVGSDGSSTAFALLRNDDPATTLSIARDFTVTFYDAYGAEVGEVSASETPGSGGSLGAALRAVPPGQLGDVSAHLDGVVAATAVVTDAAASGSPYSDARLPLSGAPSRTPAGLGSDTLAFSAVNTTGYPDTLRVVVAAEDANGNLLGLMGSMPTGAEPSGGTDALTVTYTRLPGEPVADHYSVLVAGQASGVAATTLATPTADDTPTSGTPATLRTRLLDGTKRPLAGESVLLVGRQPGKLPKVLATGRTDKLGRVALRSVLPATGELQIEFPGDATHAPIGTGDFSFRVHPRETFSGPKTILRGAAATFKGSLPDYPGEKVSIQELVHGRWRNVRTLKTDAHGAYKLVLHPSRGKHSYRATVAGTLLHLAGSSSPATIIVR